jgi:hypothetical protein
MATGTIRDLKYNYEGTYEELRSEFKKQSTTLKQAGKTEDAEKLDKILREDFEEDLKMRYSCLVQANLMIDAENIKKLKQELKSNHDLQSFEFVGLKANHDARIAVEFICHRNLLIEALEKSDLKSFIEHYSLIPVERREEVLKEEIGTKEDKLKILQLIVNKNSAETGIDSTCENLRKLDKEGGLTMLLEQCYSLNDTSPDAHKKAELISALLKIPELFEQPDDENKKAIKYEIYWATTPHGYGYVGKDVPYYNLSGLESRLQKIPESNPYKAKLTEAIQLKAKSPEFGVKDKVSVAVGKPTPTVEAVAVNKKV